MLKNIFIYKYSLEKPLDFIGSFLIGILGLEESTVFGFGFSNFKTISLFYFKFNHIWFLRFRSFTLVSILPSNVLKSCSSIFYFFFLSCWPINIMLDKPNKICKFFFLLGPLNALPFGPAESNEKIRKGVQKGFNFNQRLVL